MINNKTIEFMAELIVIAEKEELKLVEKLGYDKGYPILITGVGALNIIEALKDVPKDTHIINIGYAGSKNLEINKFYSVDYVTLYHPNVTYLENVYKLVNSGKFDSTGCYTSCDFVTETKIDDCLFDMELAYIAALGFDHIKAFKYVSDNLDLHEYRQTVNEE